MCAYFLADLAGRVRKTMPCSMGSQSRRGRSTTRLSLKNSAKKRRTALGVAALGEPRLHQRMAVLAVLLVLAELAGSWLAGSGWAGERGMFFCCAWRCAAEGVLEGVANMGLVRVEV